jgi:hypothetical protein
MICMPKKNRPVKEKKRSDKFFILGSLGILPFIFTIYIFLEMGLYVPLLFVCTTAIIYATWLGVNI